MSRTWYFSSPPQKKSPTSPAAHEAWSLSEHRPKSAEIWAAPAAIPARRAPRAENPATLLHRTRPSIRPGRSIRPGPGAGDTRRRGWHGPAKLGRGPTPLRDHLTPRKPLPSCRLTVPPPPALRSDPIISRLLPVRTTRQPLGPALNVPSFENKPAQPWHSEASASPGTKKTGATRCAKGRGQPSGPSTQPRAPGSARIVNADPDPGEGVLAGWRANAGGSTYTAARRWFDGCLPRPERRARHSAAENTPKLSSAGRPQRLNPKYGPYPGYCQAHSWVISSKKLTRTPACPQVTCRDAQKGQILLRASRRDL